MGNRKSELCSSNLALCNSINWNSVLSLKKHQNFISKSSCFRPSIVVYCFSYLYGINCIISLSLFWLYVALSITLSHSLLVVCCSVYNFISLSFIVVLSISFLSIMFISISVCTYCLFYTAHQLVSSPSLWLSQALLGTRFVFFKLLFTEDVLPNVPQTQLHFIIFHTCALAAGKRM